MMVYVMMCMIHYCVKHNIILKNNEIVLILKFDCFGRMTSMKKYLSKSEGYVIFSI